MHSSKRSVINPSIVLSRVVSSRLRVPSPPGRKVYTRWSEDEEHELTRLVQQYGVGNWSAILEAGKNVFISERTGVSLKDKWRVIQRGLQAS